MSRDQDTVTSVAPLDDTLAGGAPGRRRELPLIGGDRYRLGREVGRGGLGRVVSARDDVLEREVAIKEMLADDDASATRFTRETLITARLQHPSIIPVYDAGRTERSPFYAMKLVSGQPLERAIAEAATFEKRLALLPTVLAVTDAVAYAHSQRIIHRDLKPANVLLGKFGETVVIDWGLAKDLAIDDRDARDARPATTNDATVAGALLGTPAYMAPEQAAGEDADERADVYALGAILYHVLSGSVPHGSGSVEEVLERAIASKVRPLPEREPRTPPDLAAIVAKAMAGDKAARYRDASELAEDLRRFQTGQLVGAHRYSVGERVRRWVRRHRTLTVAAVVLAVVAIVFLIRLRNEQDQAAEARELAERQRLNAEASANRTLITQAREDLDRDPARSLAWLEQLNPAIDEGWSEARAIAAAALAHPRLELVLGGLDTVTTVRFARERRQSRGDRMRLGRRALAVSRDGRHAVALDPRGLWIVDLETGKTTTIPHRSDPQEIQHLAICDDNRRAIGKSGGFIGEHLFEIDLVAGTAVVKKTRDGAFKEAARCDLERAVEASPKGVTVGDRTITTLPSTHAWLARDREHVVVFDAGTGTLRRFDLEGHELAHITAAVTDKFAWTEAAMSRDGTVVVTMTRGIPRYWDFTSGTTIVESEDVERRLPYRFVVAPDGSWAFGSGDSGEAAVYRGATVMNTKLAVELPPGRFDVSADGAWLTALDDDGALRVHDVGAGITNRVLGQEDVLDVVHLPGRRILTSATDGSLRVYSLPAPKPRHGIEQLQRARFSPDGRWMVLLSRTKVVRRETRGPRTDTLDIEYSTGEHDAAIDDRGDVVFSRGNEVSLWPIGGAAKRLGEQKELPAVSVALLPDGTPVSKNRRRLVVWSSTPRTIELPQEAEMNPPAHSIELDATGARALVDCRTAGASRTCLVELATGRVTALANSGNVAAISADGKQSITSQSDQGCLVWDLDRMTSRSIGKVGRLQSAAIFRDGKRAVLVGSAAMVVLDLVTLDAKRPHGSVLAEGQVVVSPSGQLVVDRDTLIAWDLENRMSRALAPGASGMAASLTDDGLDVITLSATFSVPFDLPREPNALRSRIAVRYELDEIEQLVMKSEKAKPPIRSKGGGGLD